MLLYYIGYVRDDKKDLTSQSPNLHVGQVYVHQVGFTFILFNFLNVGNININKNKFKFMFYINAF